MSIFFIFYFKNHQLISIFLFLGCSVYDNYYYYFYLRFMSFINKIKKKKKIEIFLNYFFKLEGGVYLIDFLRVCTHKR